MFYAILVYDCEAVLDAWPRAAEQAALARLALVEHPLAAAGRLGPTLRLLPTTTATTLRKDRSDSLVDGPFAPAGEQLMACYIVDCPSLDAAIGVAGDIADAVGRGTCVLEVRPLCGYRPGMISA